MDACLPNVCSMLPAPALLCQQVPQHAIYVQEGDAAGMWEETFKSHTDTKLRGPEAISVDLSFPGVEHLYGLPQHADSFNLRSTRGLPLAALSQCLLNARSTLKMVQLTLVEEWHLQG